MYQITFNTKSCEWEIKLQRMYGLYWAKLNGKSFPNIESAEDYVTQVGLDKVYRDYRNSAINHVMMGGVR